MTLSTHWIVMLISAVWLASIGAANLFIQWDDKRLEQAGATPTPRATKIAFYAISPSVLGFAFMLSPFLGLAVILKGIINTIGHPRFLVVR